VGVELESVTSSAGCFVQGNASTHPHRYLPACKIWLRSDNVGGMANRNFCHNIFLCLFLFLRMSHTYVALSQRQ